MPQRKPPITEQPSGTTALRRSPRLLPKDRTSPEDPKTPEPKPRVHRVPHLHRSPLSSERKGSLKKVHKNWPAEVPKKVEEAKRGLKISNKLDSDSRISATLKRGVLPRRSPRFSGNKNTSDEFVEKKSPDKYSQGGLSNVGEGKVGIDRCKQEVAKTEKRVTRSSTKGNPDENVKKTNKDNCNARIKRSSVEVSDKKDLLNVEKAEVGGSSCKRFAGKLNKEESISGAKKGKCIGFMESASPEVLHGNCLPDVERARGSGNSCKRTEAKLEKRWTRNSGPSGAPSVVTVGGEENEDIDLDKGMKVNGVKRKRNQVKEGHGIVQAWTRDQELALQGAYFAVKPTPHFWKKVAKLVRSYS